MTEPFLAGMLAAWAVTQVGLGVYFFIAFRLRRLELEYLLFALLCASLALLAAGMSAAYLTVDTAERMRASRFLHVGAIAAPVFNLHFVVRFVRIPIRFWVMAVLYAAGACYELANAAGFWLAPDGYAVDVATVMGHEFGQARTKLTLVGASFYVFGGLEFLAGIALLGWAWVSRSGSREALSALAGASLLGLAVINDVLLATGKLTNSLYLVPHAFLVYALAVASTLLFRYRTAAVQRESTVQSLHARTRELARSHAELRDIQAELLQQKQLAAVGEMAASIAHEVRNPLAVIVNALAGLRRQPGREEDRQTLLDIVGEETARLNRLVADLLRFARPVPVQRVRVPLPELMRLVLQNREHAAVALELPARAEHCEAWVDVDLFRVVVENLVDNASQAGEPGSTVTLRVSSDQLGNAPALRFDVQDSGPGMEKSVLERAMDPFFTTRPSGTGLGLSIVRRIVQAHGGTLVLVSDAGQGTIARVVIPQEAPE
jgi:signal transduction histidine kinase